MSLSMAMAMADKNSMRTATSTATPTATTTALVVMGLAVGTAMMKAFSTSSSSSSSSSSSRTRAPLSLSSTVSRQRSKSRIGILGGSGPEAGADLFQKVLRIHRQRMGANYKSDKDAPDILLHSCSGIGGPRSHVDMEPGSKSLKQGWEALSAAIREMAPLVDCFCICCNQLHCFEDQTRDLLVQMKESPDKLVSIVQVTATHLQQSMSNAAGPIAILGNPITTDLAGLSPYRKLVDIMGNEKMKTLSGQQRECLKNIITTVKKKGVVSAATAKEFTELLEDLKGDGVEIAVLACTELPIISRGMDSQALSLMKLVDPTELVATELVLRALEPPNK